MIAESRRRAIEEREQEEEARARAAEEAAASIQDPTSEAPTVEVMLADPPAGSAGDVESTAAELSAPAYVLAPTDQVHHDDLLVSPTSEVVRAIAEIVEVESPIHMAELASRVAAQWGVSRVGSRILTRITHECDASARRGLIDIRGEFVWSPRAPLTVRSRTGTKLSAERIAPEEYREAALMVLRARGSAPRAQLTAEIRNLLGYSRTGAKLEEMIGSTLDALLAEGVLGEASTGICIRV
jgi:hypothetical protein